MRRKTYSRFVWGWSQDEGSLHRPYHVTPDIGEINQKLRTEPHLLSRDWIVSLKVFLCFCEKPCRISSTSVSVEKRLQKLLWWHDMTMSVWYRDSSYCCISGESIECLGFDIQWIVILCWGRPPRLGPGHYWLRNTVTLDLWDPRVLYSGGVVSTLKVLGISSGNTLIDFEENSSFVDQWVPLTYVIFFLPSLGDRRLLSDLPLGRVP